MDIICGISSKSVKKADIFKNLNRIVLFETVVKQMIFENILLSFFSFLTPFEFWPLAGKKYFE